MVLGSHNAWSYLSPRKWWMKLIGFTAQCQRKTIDVQYNDYGVRCFDLRLRFDADGKPMIVHGPVEYVYTPQDIQDDLKELNERENVSVRVLLDVRSERQYTQQQRDAFWNYCHELEMYYPNIKFWCGRNLYDWTINYNFLYFPTCIERYASVCKPRLIDDWWPHLFASRYNHGIIEQGTDKDILLVDFVDIR